MRKIRSMWVQDPHPRNPAKFQMHSAPGRCWPASNKLESGRAAPCRVLRLTVVSMGACVVGKSNSEHAARAPSPCDVKGFRALRESPFLAWPRKGNPKEGPPGAAHSGHPALRVRARWPLVGGRPSMAVRRLAAIQAATLRAFRAHRSPPLRGPNINRSALPARRGKSKSKSKQERRSQSYRRRPSVATGVNDSVQAGIRRDRRRSLCLWRCGGRVFVWRGRVTA
jgi:hypothetical protein